jgi:hypothetical protein
MKMYDGVAEFLSFASNRPRKDAELPGLEKVENLN